MRYAHLGHWSYRAVLRSLFASAVTNASSTAAALCVNYVKPLTNSEMPTSSQCSPVG